MEQQLFLLSLSKHQKIVNKRNEKVVKDSIWILNKYLNSLISSLCLGEEMIKNKTICSVAISLYSDSVCLQLYSCTWNISEKGMV